MTTNQHLVNLILYGLLPLWGILHGRLERLRRDADA
jgi:hypothetical protein